MKSLTCEVPQNTSQVEARGVGGNYSIGQHVSVSERSLLTVRLCACKTGKPA
jgi:hypothetical protein